MQLTLPEILSLAIIFPAVISVVRVRTTDSAYLPFFILLWVGCINELLSIGLMHYGNQTAINNNIYVLLEALLILSFFRTSKISLQKYVVFFLLISSCVVFWMIENFFISTIKHISSYFRIYYSFIVVILSINAINYLLFSERNSLLKLPSFLVSACFVIFFTYKILIEAFWLKGLNNSTPFRDNVYTILVYLNLFVNLVFALVALWIPKKQEHMLLF